jgi:anti-sigma-K factor RskA
MNTPTLPFEQDPPERDVLAGEYVLGVLDAQQRAAAEQRIASDPAFAAEVAFWENRFMALAEQIAPVPVPDYVWARISSALGFGPAPRAPVAPDRASFWDRVGPWRWLTAGGFATAAVCAIALLTILRTPETVAPPPLVVAPPAPAPLEPTPMAVTLSQEDGKPGYVATVDARSGRMTITPLQPIVESGRVQELWLIPADGTPRSLGIIDAERAQSRTIPEALLALLEAGAIFAVTLEPPGGAPQGAPTGPITAKGAIALL